MAEKSVAVDLSEHERQVTKHALLVYRQTLVRSSAKEVMGSPVYELRKREVQFVDSLIARY